MEISTQSVPTLAGGTDSTYSLDISTPTIAGDYYYAVCVDAVTGEAFTSNNCSEVKRVHVYTPLEEAQRTDFDMLSVAGNNNPRGLWSDGTTMWVADYADAKLYAYNLVTKARDSVKDFNTRGCGNTKATGLWSDGTTIWVANNGLSDDRLYAYNLATKARDAAKDLNTRAVGNSNATGLWSDGTTLWVADWVDDKLYAYNLVTQARDTTKDFNTLDAAGNNNPVGLWSDGTTMWIADNRDVKLYAYNLATKARDAAKDFNMLPAVGNNDPQGLWSDGTTMWVVDDVDDKLYAYSLVPKVQTVTFTLSETTYQVSDAAITLSASTDAIGLTDFTFTSSDPGVAAVNGDQLTFISPGTAKIIATQAGDANYVASSDSIEITVNKGMQVVTFTLSKTTYKIGDAAIILSASTDVSVLTGFTFSSSDPGVAAVRGNELSFISPGTAKITATQAGNADYTAGSESVDITVNKGMQVVTFTLSKTTYKVSDAAITLSASTDISALTGFTFSSSTPGVAAVSGDQLSFISPGTAKITATQAGNANYAAGSESVDITVNKGMQVVTFTLSKTTYKIGDAAITLSASTDISALTGFTFSSSDPGVAVVSGNQLTFVSPGTAKITATQAGNANYAAGSDSVEITVNKGIQVVTFTLSETTYKVGDAAITLSASTDISVLTGFTFSSSDTGVAAVNGKLSFVSPGTALIIATQAGDANYVASSDSIEITVNKGMQVVTFTLSKTTYKVSNAAITLSASTDATGLTDFIFSSRDPGVAEVNGNELSFISPGTAKIIATQAGNANYAAGSDSVEITVNKGIQVVDFTLSKTTYKVSDAAITLSASTDISALTGFTFSSSTPGVAAVSGNQLTFVSPGTAKITATQVGNADYAAGSDSVEITVNKGMQVVTFTLSKTTYKIGDAAITLSASTDATGLTGFTFSSNVPGVAEVTGNQLTFVSPGTAKIIATQAGNANYAAGSESVDITVNKGMQVVTLTLSKTTYKVGSAAVTLSASTDATGLTGFTFSSSDTGVAAVNGNELTFVSVGTAKITATQAGNADYAAGNESVDIMVTDKQIQTITFTLSKTTYKVGDAAVTLSASTDATGLTDFTFSSSTPGVAAVTGNQLTFVSPGTAKIIATQAGNADYAAGSESVDITVTDKQIQTIIFTLSETTYKIGDAAVTLSASTDATGLTDFTFSSSDPGVAEVTGNQLTFISAGTAKITATQAGNVNYAAGSESVDITVTDKQIQTITFILSKTTYKVSDAAVTLSASTDATGLTGFTFSSSAPGVAEVTGNQLTFVSAGTAKITATQAGNVNYAAGSDSVEITVTVVESILGTSSIEEGAVLYPNPTSGVLYLDMEADEVRVYDIRGRLLKELFGMVRSVDFDHGMGVAGQYIVEVVLNGRSTRYLILKE